MRAEKLDPFKYYIVARMKAAETDGIPATVYFCEIRARGYDSSETCVKQFVRGLVLATKPEPAVRFMT